MEQEKMTYRLLDKVDSPKDIKNFSIEELRELCAEIRHYMIECCSVNPGHLGSSLGAVELMVGMHYVYDTPDDKLVFDVGHQAYAHKIITGRREAFRQNRTKDGISGFPKRSESIYDAFGAGHSSTSISAALGFAEAAKIQGLGHKAVALIGDGSLTGGLALEGLNNAGVSKTDMLVILNDNNISIDKNIGGLHEYLLKITTAPGYNKAKKRIWDRLGDGCVRKAVQKVVATTKSYLVRNSGGHLFQAMGFRYFGPIDGNDIVQVVETLKKLKEISGPLLLHVMTKKGKGYAPAEEDQTTWHAPGIFDPETGMRQKSKNKKLMKNQLLKNQ
jgi:1-deoxy-D-xylulose-5-phosphate synthase